MPSLVLCLRAAGAFSAGAQPVAALPRRPPLTSSSRWLSLSAVSPPQCSLSPEHPGQQHLSTAPRPATSSRWRSATAPLPAVSLPLRRPRPATNLIRQRSTPVWLAIWRTWAGFANSQLRRATIRAPNNISAHPPCCHIGRCSDRANLSTHLHRLPTPPPYLRRMRLSPGRGRRCRVLDIAVA